MIWFLTDSPLQFPTAHYPLSQMNENPLEILMPSPEVLLSFLTFPVIVGIVSAETVIREIQESTAASEEILRGDRLPILPFPNPNKTPQNRNE